MTLRSPLNGEALRPAGPHTLTDGERRWPFLDGIAYLRVGREALIADVLRAIDAGDEAGGLALLLADQDDWWRGARARPDAIAGLIASREHLSLREAMRRLEWGPVADYFAYRWSDPTFLAGLGLVEAHWCAPATAFELACGIGHHLRALADAGVAVVGADVVFAKLWIARHWVTPAARLVCFDASAAWPVTGRFDLAACHDAFYFLEPKPLILERLRGLATTILVGHIHNRDWPNFSAGHAVTASELAALCPHATIYDDAELTRAVAEARAPVAAAAAALGGVEAFSIAEGATGAAARLGAGITMPAAGRPLRRNPLYDANGRVGWPSERYRQEYAPRATFGTSTRCPAEAVSDPAVADWARRRELVDLPDRW